MKSKLVLVVAAAGALSLLAGEPAAEPSVSDFLVGRYVLSSGSVHLPTTPFSVVQLTLKMDTLSGRTWVLASATNAPSIFWRELLDMPSSAPNVPPTDGTRSASTKPR